MTNLKILAFSLVMAFWACPIRAQEHRPFQIKGHEGEFIKIGKQIYKIPYEPPSYRLTISSDADIISVSGKQYVAHKGVLYRYDPPNSLNFEAKISTRIAGEAETIKVVGATYVIHGGNLYRLPSSHNFDLLSITDDPNKPQKFQVDGEAFILFQGKIHRYPKN